MKKYLSQITSKHLFILLLLGATLINSVFLVKEVWNAEKKRKILPYFFLGTKFSGLETVLKNTQYVGYYTDKDLDKKIPASQFAQAQYTLAPIILDLDFQKHEFILFDCSSEEVARKKIAEIGAQALKRNQFGIFLARQQQ